MEEVSGYATAEGMKTVMLVLWHGQMGKSLYLPRQKKPS